MRATDAEEQWAKLGIKQHLSFIGKDVVLFCQGCFIKAINVKTLEEHSLAVNFHSKNGDGVKCIRGHTTLNVFAYVENCQNPDLYIMNYPSFQVISRFEYGLYEGYKCLTFSETSLLFTLGNKPNYVISVWNWRSEEKFCENSNNEILAEQQMLRKTIFSKHFVSLGKEKPAPFYDMVWTTDGGFFLIDQKGELYTLGRDFTLEKVVEWNETGDVHPNIAYYKAGIVASGPSRLLRHYKKSGSWVCDWSYEPPVTLRQILCNRGEHFVGKTDNSELVLLGTTLESMTFIDYNQSNFDDICLVYPEGQYVAALCNSKILSIFEVTTGKLVNTFAFNSEALVVSENPEFPYVAVGKKNGMMKLVSLYDVRKITHMTKFHLSHNPITHIKFFEHGRMIVAGNASLGELFIIEGLPGSQMEVISRIEVNHCVVDFFLVSSSNCYRFFVLPATSGNAFAGNKFIRYCIISKNNINVKEYQIENDQLYYRIHPTRGQHRDRVFYALPLASRRIHTIETKRGDDVARLTSEILTGHILRQFHFRQTKYHALTFGYDGFVIVRDSNFERVAALTLAHHRYLGGVKVAYIDPLEQYIVSLGRDNVMACMKLPLKELDYERKQRIDEFKQSSKFALMFKRPTLGFDPQGRFKDKTWTEVEEILKFEKDEAICRVERQGILHEFHLVQSVLQQLVTQNLEGPENESIDLLEFYLDQNMYHAMQQQNKEDCKQTDIYLRALIAAQDKVSNYMIKTYWEPMGVIWKVIYGFFANFQATNYCLLPENLEKLQRLAWIEEQRKVEQFLSSHDTFEPWVLMPKSKLLMLVKKPPRLPREDYSGMAAQRRLKHLEEAETEKTQETRVALAGSVSMLYIDISPGHYQQRQLVSFYQCELQQAVAEREHRRGPGSPRNTARGGAAAASLCLYGRSSPAPPGPPAAGLASPLSIAASERTARHARERPGPAVGRPAPRHRRAAPSAPPNRPRRPRRGDVAVRRRRPRTAARRTPRPARPPPFPRARRRMKMDMTQESCLELITEFQNREVLWNPRHPSYYNSNRKEEAWREISAKFNKDVEDVKRKLESLKGSYRREKTRVRKSMGKGRRHMYTSRWFAYESFKFLDNREDKKPSVNNTQVNESEEDYDDYDHDDADDGLELGQLENCSEPDTEQNSQSIVIKYEPSENMFIQPKQQQKKKSAEEDTKVSLVFDSLQKAAVAIKPPERDECTVFGEHVANKLRKLDDRLRAMAHHKISNVLFELEMVQHNDMVFPQNPFAQHDS